MDRSRERKLLSTSRDGGSPVPRAFIRYLLGDAEAYPVTQSVTHGRW